MQGTTEGGAMSYRKQVDDAGDEGAGQLTDGEGCGWKHPMELRCVPCRA